MNHWYQVIVDYCDPRMAADTFATNNAGVAFQSYGETANRMNRADVRRVCLLKSGMIIAISEPTRELGNVGRTAFKDMLTIATVAEENYK